MPYCYACRNNKPATHAHFADYGALALRPPKRHITAIEEQWDRMSEEAQAAALDRGRQILAQELAGEELAQEAPGAAIERQPRARQPQRQPQRQEARQEEARQERREIPRETPAPPRSWWRTAGDVAAGAVVIGLAALAAWNEAQSKARQGKANG